jgi:hypothetical protein
MGVRVSFLEESPGAGAAPPAVAARGALVPPAAIRQEDGKDVVYVEREGRAERREVRLGGTQGDARQVTGGLSPGENVIVEAPPSLADGVAVTVRGGAET